ncbi:hypothetical protein P3X46_014150 [Hevea brasiliensis]|uniref:CTLH domain-containing protein n=1 Tax=Hevea brasiliensis TaxID=3981 RepID=A0ABQ9M5Q5_HEVBR|nr:hypothetical protein P3X46_014150 [Hevea brasiliensis]
MTKDDVIQHLTSLVSRLQGLKRKLEEGSRTEHLQAQRCRARLDYLESVDKRILVDYMLRMSYYDTGMKLPKSSNMLDLVDVAVFQEARRVIDALQNREVAPALAWCTDNKSPLKKSKLRLQEFIELVRAENNMCAIAYARKYLAPWGVLFESKQWDYLVDQFKQEFCRLYGMTLEPLLNIYLKAGLFGLKAPKLWKLALPLLPYSKQHHSKLACYITKELMDTENPQQVLPNGHVYSTKAPGEMAKKNNGKITCSRIGLICSYSEVVKAYIS